MCHTGLFFLSTNLSQKRYCSKFWIDLNVRRRKPHISHFEDLRGLSLHFLFLLPSADLKWLLNRLTGYKKYIPWIQNVITRTWRTAKMSTNNHNKKEMCDHKEKHAQIWVHLERLSLQASFFIYFIFFNWNGRELASKRISSRVISKVVSLSRKSPPWSRDTGINFYSENQ